MSLGRCLILANSPCYSQLNNLGTLVAGYDTFIALDGVANFLEKTKLEPTIILGDFDSITQTSKVFFEERGTRFVYTPDQNKTDLEKAIEFCDANKAIHIDLYNALGGRNDHSIGNISFLKKCFSEKRRLRIFSETECLEIIFSATKFLKGPAHKNVAFFGLPEASITTQGLAYDMTRYRLFFGQQESIANAMGGTLARIEVEGFALVIYDKSLCLLDSPKVG